MNPAVEKDYLVEDRITRTRYLFPDDCFYAMDVSDEVLENAYNPSDLEAVELENVIARHEMEHRTSLAPSESREDFPCYVLSLRDLTLNCGEVHPFWLQLAQRIERGEVRPISFETWNGTAWVDFPVVPLVPEASPPEPPTTYCFDCGQMVPVAETWAKKSDPNYALCEGCFRIAEAAGRAKEATTT